MMGTITALHASTGPTLREASDAYLEWQQMISRDTSKGDGTVRKYRSILRELAREFGDDATPGDLDPEAVAAWFAGRWGELGASTYNVARAALHSAGSYWADTRGWIPASPFTLIPRRGVPADSSRAMTRADVDKLLGDDRVPLRERLLWRMAYESAARVSELLGLDIDDLDMPQRQGRVNRKGGAIDLVFWQTASARLLPRYLAGRERGPVFITERLARVELAPCDLAPGGQARLAYDTAEDLLVTWSERILGKRVTFHQWRHSALTHGAEDGTSVVMLKARSGHRSLRSLEKYIRPSAEAVRAHMDANDPARRR